MIKIQNLKYSFNKIIFRKNSFRYDLYIENLVFKRGDKVGICGLNGSGKSTLIKLLSGILIPNQGNIEVLGYKPNIDRENYVKNITVLWGQRSNLWVDLTPLENFKIISKLYSVDKEYLEKFIDYSTKELFCVDLLNKQVRKLSLGQRIKIEIIASLIHNPSILFYDEAFLGLDFKSKKEIRKYINEYILKNKATLFIISHDIEDIENMCDEIVILDKGRVVKKENIKSIVSRKEKQYSLKIYLRENIKADFEFLNIEGIFIKNKGVNYIELVIDTKIKRSFIITEIIERLDISSIEFNDNNLENIILDIVDGGKNEEI